MEDAKDTKLKSFLEGTKITIPLSVLMLLLGAGGGKYLDKYKSDTVAHAAPYAEIKKELTQFKEQYAADKLLSQEKYFGVVVKIESRLSAIESDVKTLKVSKSNNNQ